MKILIPNSTAAQMIEQKYIVGIHSTTTIYIHSSPIESIHLIKNLLCGFRL